MKKYNKGNLKKIRIPPKSAKLVEFIGIVLGDGNIHLEYNRVTIVGSLEDIYYYKYHVIPLIVELFNIIPKLKKRKDRNAYYIYFYSKPIIDFLINEIGLIRGNKKNAKIPLFILKNKKLYPPFLRGLFDTDGCLKFSKQSKSYNYYPRLELGFTPSTFSNQLKYLFEKLGFNYGKWSQGRKFVLLIYQLSGTENLEKWMELISPKNPVHFSKYLFWDKFGYYIPKSSLKSRIEALNLYTNDLF
tara:strand:- start:571 stop:1302 length:732 start_codon:yes stop_codon:yes gene_type:complete